MCAREGDFIAIVGIVRWVWSGSRPQTSSAAKLMIRSETRRDCVHNTIFVLFDKFKACFKSYKPVAAPTTAREILEG